MTTPDSEPNRRTAADDRHGLHDLADDAVGFGMAEIRTAWAMLVRPRRSLELYMTLGPTADGTLARPLRLYLALNAVMMLIMFLFGGMEGMFQGLPSEGLQALADNAGKPPAEFMADADGWMSLAIVPISSTIYALILTPFLRWWDPDDLGWRKGFRATFVYLNILTVPFLPLTLLMYDPRLMGWSMLIFVGLSFYGFLRAGPGRWFSNWAVGVLKALALSVMILIGQFLAAIPMLLIGFLGGTYGA
ncbi:MAG: hypothetical protein KJ676_07775 [Alphaproteobacteria bacterium]|nr:hypothetical protein [Alphaproteobacteria bacterium]MBU1524789.1 hypothetical protein [Alphaproteobacteria bacterium]MBU2116661.1 hypothetical protein [Alphaproteobacteria bacterium]MBU2349911.1 hypothetical protein [Alphaproteobacteria bacterium]MBU2383654.1 hypothetical protein [Alphaproteobacteria bacterium]